METLTIKTVIKRLIGHIKPVGESNRDAKALENLKEFSGATDFMVEQLIDVAGNSDSYEASVKACGEAAKDTLKHITERLTDGKVVLTPEEFKAVIIEAVDWENTATDEDRHKLTYVDLKKKSIDRVFNKYV